MMAITNVELYEALKPTVGEKAAKLMAEVVPPAQHLATRHDLSDAVRQLERVVHDGFRALTLEVRGVDNRVAALESRVSRLEGRFSLLLMFLIPMWVGLSGTMAAILIRT